MQTFVAVSDSETLRSKIISIFNDLHNDAEVSMKEYHTTAYVIKKLNELGYSTKTLKNCPGVIGEIGNEKPVVALRADMDALWQEVDGKYQANHSCGHDAHMTMALGVAMILKQRTEHLKGTVRIIFQPAEETGQGALALCKEGVMEDVNFLYGVHLRPIQEIADGRASSAILHGASQTIEGTIHGEDAHAARPHLGINSIEVAAMIIDQIAQIHINPTIPHSVKMTSLHSGAAANIIPGLATFTLDLRAQSNAALDILVEKVKLIIKSIEQASKSKINLSFAQRMTAATVSQEAEKIMADSITAVLGKDKLESPITTTGGDDFHQYKLKYPNLKTTMLGLGCGLKPGLHHPKMTFNQNAMFSGINILSTAILETLVQFQDGQL